MRKFIWLLLLIGAAATALMGNLQGQDMKASQKVGVTSAELYEAIVPNAPNMEATVLDVRYLPGAINPRHFHPATVTFYVVSGTPVFQEEGKEPVTLKPGDSLLVPAGTTHAHWNPSKTAGVHWLEFIVAEKGKGRSIRKP